jgi:hypothetical protein
MNKYGFFRYKDFAFGAKESQELSSDTEMQPGASVQQLKNGVQPVAFASFEQNAYITSKPLPLYKGSGELGFLTSFISEEDGSFPNPPIIRIDFPEYFSMTGLTIHSRNVISEAQILGMRDGKVVASGIFSASDKLNFFPISLELVNSIEIGITKINEPYHFLGIYDIEYGRSRDFGDPEIESVRVTNNFSVLGDTIEYDTLDLTVVNPEDEDGYLFQQKQPIDYIVNNTVRQKFYIDSGDEHTNGTTDLLAYDETANLEGEFLGGIYENYPFSQLVSEILKGYADYRIEANEVLLSGYIPICTRRKALQIALLAANLRLYRSNCLVFKSLESAVREEIFDQTNILENPQKTKKQPVRAVTVKYHNYSKGTEETEIHHWYLSKTEPTMITFSKPAHTLKAFEVIGTDDSGNDIVSESESENVTFTEIGANYCVVENASDNKIVIIGIGYADSSMELKKTNSVIGRNQLYKDYTVDITLHGNTEETLNLLFDMYSRKDSIRFKTINDVEVGGLYNILGSLYHIKKKKNTLDGVYEVEAV